ncbi:unnamed protein product [Caenorhabditis angaria]|uniref:C-type lectin domain-containing protein n=1 Tax=Caenorhabditis angaria TaxID=860376 RepID=A0A9P1MUN0_9PELO|nr:unnamed protein product [Caenorhabditis angaria]
MILKVLMLLVCVELVDLCNVRPEGTCEAGWTYYKREKTGWCMKLVAQNNLNKTDAEQICNNLGAVISSIDNMAMYNFTFSLSNDTSLQAWLGAKLIAKCDCGMAVCPWIDGCDETGYEWTDGFSLTTPSNSIDKIIAYGPGISANGTKTYNRLDSLCFNFDWFAQTCNSDWLLTSVICGKPV